MASKTKGWKESIFKGSFDRVTIILALMVVVSLGILGFRTLQPKPFSPLDEYSRQQVKLAVEPQGLGVYPTLHIKTGKETLPVHAKKCSEELVQIAGVNNWQEVDPPGTVIVNAKGTGTRLKGCQEFDYENTIPLGVMDRLKNQAETGQMISRWKITGEETPLAPDGNQFVVSKTYESDEFVLIYEIPVTTT